MLEVEHNPTASSCKQLVSEIAFHCAVVHAGGADAGCMSNKDPNHVVSCVNNLAQIPETSRKTSKGFSDYFQTTCYFIFLAVSWKTAQNADA